jgi:hypothetical protein
MTNSIFTQLKTFQPCIKGRFGAFITKVMLEAGLEAFRERWYL